VTGLYLLSALYLIYTEHPPRIEQYRATNIHYDYIVITRPIVTEVSSNLRSQLRTYIQPTTLYRKRLIYSYVLLTRPLTGTYPYLREPP
jgi:hypothetical protein